LAHSTRSKRLVIKVPYYTVIEYEGLPKIGAIGLGGRPPLYDYIYQNEALKPQSVIMRYTLSKF